MGTGSTWAAENLAGKTNVQLAQALAVKQENHTHFYDLAKACKEGADLLYTANRPELGDKLMEQVKLASSTAAFCAEVSGWIGAELAQRENSRRLELNILIGALTALAEDVATKGYSSAACRLHNYATDLEVELADYGKPETENKAVAPSDHDPDAGPFCECAMCRAREEKELRELAEADKEEGRWQEPPAN